MSEDELNRQRAMNEDKARGLRTRILELEAKELRWDKGLENWEKAYKRLEKERDELLTKEAHAIHDKLAAEKRFLSVESDADQFINKLDEMWDRMIDPFRPGGSRFGDVTGLRTALAEFDLKFAHDVRGWRSRKKGSVKEPVTALIDHGERLILAIPKEGGNWLNAGDDAIEIMMNGFQAMLSLVAGLQDVDTVTTAMKELADRAMIADAKEAGETE